MDSPTLLPLLLRVALPLIVAAGLARHDLRHAEPGGLTLLVAVPAGGWDRAWVHSDASGRSRDVAIHGRWLRVDDLESGTYAIDLYDAGPPVRARIPVAAPRAPERRALDGSDARALTQALDAYAHAWRSGDAAALARLYDDAYRGPTGRPARQRLAAMARERRTTPLRRFDHTLLQAWRETDERVTALVESTSEWGETRASSGLPATSRRTWRLEYVVRGGRWLLHRTDPVPVAWPQGVVRQYDVGSPLARIAVGGGAPIRIDADAWD